MIVDLLRNDLGKICTAGSVQVVKSKSIQKLEKVFHTYSVVQGHIKQDIPPIEALLSMNPGGYPYPDARRNGPAKSSMNWKIILEMFILEKLAAFYRMERYNLILRFVP